MLTLKGVAKASFRVSEEDFSRHESRSQLLNLDQVLSTWPGGWIDPGKY